MLLIVENPVARNWKKKAVGVFLLLPVQDYDMQDARRDAGVVWCSLWVFWRIQGWVNARISSEHLDLDISQPYSPSHVPTAAATE